MVQKNISERHWGDLREKAAANILLIAVFYQNPYSDIVEKEQM